MEPRQRDDAIRAALRRRLGDDRADDVCPDAEIIGAYMERTLSSDEIDLWTTHFGRCDRCRQHLAALVRATPDAVATPPVSAADGTDRESTLLAWLFDWRMLTPAAAVGVLVLSVWTLDRGAVERTAPTGPVEMAETETDQPGTPTAASRTDADAERALEQAPVTAANELADEAIGATSSGTRDRLAERENAAPAPETIDALTEPPAPTLGRQESPRRMTLAAPEEASLQRAPMVVVSSPDPLVRWRVTADGIIERTNDGGTSWTFELDTGGAELGAGTAPSAFSCWIVGRSGAVFVTTDGSTWRRVGQPTPWDLTGVQATDGRTATVTTADGQQFDTTNGGLSWTPR